MIILEDFQNWLYFFFGSLISLVIFERIAKKLGKRWGTKMWEILVPASNKELEFTYEHHKAWDEYVKSLAGGLTIMKSAKGEWIDTSNNELYKDRVIPVRIKCSKKNIKKIIKFTIKHYNQEAVLAYKVSDRVILTHKNEI
jgi:hypothetical protein